jgi:hypothetical protein
LPLLFAALTYLAKSSAVVYIPLVLLAVEIERLLRSILFPNLDAQLTIGLWSRIGQFLRSAVVDGLQIGCGGFLLAILYCSFGSGSAFRGEWAFDNQPHGAIGHMLWQINQYLHSYALGALTFQMRHQEDGHGGSFLLGQWYPEGVWYYFPVALSLKLGLPVLLGTGLVAAVRPRALANAVALAAALLLLYSMDCRVQIGIRLVLPVIALLVVGVSAGLVQFFRRVSVPWGRASVWMAAVAGVLWTLVGTLSVWPHALCYANEAAGGPGRNHLNLGDSNHDWGQGLPELLAWQRSHADAPLCVWYFGSDPQLKAAPLTSIDLHAMPPDVAEERLEGCYLAVSMSHLHGGAGQCAMGERLRNIQPIGRTMTFVIYDFTQPVHQDE